MKINGGGCSQQGQLGLTDRKGTHSSFAIHSTPFVLLLNDEFKAIGRGIANTVEHLESLISLETVQVSGRGTPNVASTLITNREAADVNG